MVCSQGIALSTCLHGVHVCSLGALMHLVESHCFVFIKFRSVTGQFDRKVFIADIMNIWLSSVAVTRVCCDQP